MHCRQRLPLGNAFPPRLFGFSTWATGWKRIEERMKTVLLCWLLVAGAVLACEVPVFRFLLGNRFSSPEFMELQEPG